MGREHNDYFKVNGKSVEDRDIAAASRARLSSQEAKRRQTALAPPNGKSDRNTIKAQRATSSRTTKASPVSARTMKSSTEVPAMKPSVSAPTATVRTIHVEKPRHGKKRRSSQRRHEVGVLAELREHPEETRRQASHGAGRRPADVIPVTRGQRASAAAQQHAASQEQPRGIFRRVRHAAQSWRQVIEFAGELLAAPVTLVRLLRELRRRPA
jgi:hypothetical protein